MFAVAALVTYTGLRVRAAGLSKEVYEESLKKAESTVKIGKSLEEEGGKLQAEEQDTIGRMPRKGTFKGWGDPGGRPERAGARRGPRTEGADRSRGAYQGTPILGVLMPRPIECFLDKICPLHPQFKQTTPLIAWCLVTCFCS